MFFKGSDKPAEEITLGEALKPVIIYTSIKIALMVLLREAIRASLKHQERIRNAQSPLADQIGKGPGADIESGNRDDS